MDENNLNEVPSQNPNQNFGAGGKTFTPPTDNQGINAPREAVNPQFHADTYSKIAAQNELLAQASGENASPAAQPEKPLQDRLAELNVQQHQAALAEAQSGNVVAAKTPSQNWKIVVRIFAIVSMLYLGFWVFWNIAGWFMGNAPSIWSLIIWFCWVAMIIASVSILKFKDEARKRWIRIATILCAVTLIAIGIIVFIFIRANTEQNSSLQKSLSSLEQQQQTLANQKSSAAYSQTIAQANQQYIDMTKEAISENNATTFHNILTVILSTGSTLIIYIAGIIFLSRKPVYFWFS